MGNRTTRVALAVLAFGVVVGRADRATAGLMTYTETIQAQGSLGQNGFSSMILSLTADTSGITQGGANHYSGEVTSATVTVNGLTATFTDQVYFFAGNNYAGFTDIQPITHSGVTIADVYNPGFTNYNLSTALGPLTGLAGGPTDSFSTSLGTLQITQMTGNGTFTAATATVPEPASLTLCCVGMAGLAVVGIRRKWVVA